MESHPGLEFLKATPEFQDRYGFIWNFLKLMMFFKLKRWFIVFSSVSTGGIWVKSAGGTSNKAICSKSWTWSAEKTISIRSGTISRMSISMWFTASSGNLITIMTFSSMKRISAGWNFLLNRPFLSENFIENLDFIVKIVVLFRYAGHALSRKTVARIFSEIPKKFKSKQKDQMNYEDFVCFLTFLTK